MRTDFTVSPELLKSYLSQGIRPEDKKRLLEQAQKNAGLKLLLELLDGARSNPAIDPELPYHEKESPRFEYLSITLEDCLAGTATPEQQQQLVSGLLHSRPFFLKTMIMLEELTPTLAGEALPEAVADLSGVKNNQTLLAETVLAAGPAESLMEKLRNLGESVWKPLEDLLPSFRVAGGISAALALVIILAILIIPGKQDPFAPYRWEASIPYSSAADNATGGFAAVSEFRGGEAETRIVQHSNTLAAVYQEAMKKYQKSDYQTARQFWLRADQSAVELETQLANLNPASTDIPSEHLDNYKRLLQNYYFYRGLTSLAELRQGTEGKDSQEQFASILADLKHARQLAEQFALDTDDREIFFMALAAGFQGNHLESRQLLGQVGSGSAFYPEAQKLIGELKTD